MPSSKEINVIAAILILWIIAIIVVLATSFKASLPTWCANPQGSGNHLVQPLCEKK
jgi:hypothetical protein